MADEDLLARVERLERALERFQARATMRGSRSCPACGCERVVHVVEMQERAGKGGYAVKMGLVHQAAGFFTSPEAIVPLEAYACSACGLVEWYAKSFAALLAGAKPNERIEILKPEETETGPYR
jgi:hypothetical protein